MPALKIGFATRSLRRPIRSAFDFAAKTGADGVEIDLRNELPVEDLTPTALRQMRKLLEDLRLSLAVATFPTRRGFGDPDQLDRRLAATKAAIKAAGQVGARVLVVSLGPVPSVDNPDERTLLLESLSLLAKQGEHFGVQLALSAGGPTVSRVADLLANLPPRSIGVCLNPAELLAEGQEPIEMMQLLGGSLLHLYAADAVRDLSAHGAVAVELGRGSVDWPELLGQLEEFDYRGWASLTLRQGGQPAEMANAVAYLRNVG